MSHRKPRIFDDTPRISRADARRLGLKRYFTGETCGKGHVAPRYVKSKNCVVCLADAALDWQRRMRSELGDAYRKKVRDVLKGNPGKFIFAGTKSRAKKRGIEFSISLNDVPVPDQCPCCQRTLNLLRDGPNKKGPNPASPSIDRLDNRLGYVPGNVAVICWRCNELKRNASINELRTILAWLESINPPRVTVVASGKGYDRAPPVQFLRA